MPDEKPVIYPIEKEKFIIPESESEVIYQVNNFEGYTYDIKKDDRVKTPEELQNFLNKIDAICKKYDFSISHEDTQGG